MLDLDRAQGELYRRLTDPGCERLPRCPKVRCINAIATSTRTLRGHAEGGVNA